MQTVPLALLAGGLATRLGPIARAVPKSLMDVNGRPFIDLQLELLRNNGIRHVVLCLGHLGEQIEQYLGDGSSHGLSVRYSYDGDSPAGTAGALRWALPMLGDAFWVMYGDSYMDIDYAAVFECFARSQAIGLMTVIRNENRWDRSNVMFENGGLVRYDKRNPTPDMNYIDYGAQLLRREALLHLAPGEQADLADVYGSLIAQGKMIGHEVHNRFHEIGTPKSLEETRRALANIAPPAAA
jgi:NDP-sugar pyrophosphorylase family protein